MFARFYFISFVATALNVYADMDMTKNWISNVYPESRQCLHGLSQFEAIQLALKLENYKNGSVSWYQIADVCNGAIKNKSKSRTLLLLQHAMLNKGYDTTLSGVFDSKMIAAAKSLYEDIFGNRQLKNIQFDPVLLEAVASKHMYKNSGKSAIRKVQQYLNRKYAYTCNNDYFIGIGPCHGLNCPETGKLLTCGFQTETGIPIDNIIESRAAFGPMTRDLSSKFLQKFDKNKADIVKCALVLNGVLNSFDEKINSATVRSFEKFYNKAIKLHQKNMYLPITGKLDLDTLLSLFVSCGNKERKVTACDCATQLSFEQAYALYLAGYRYVGRYLTGVVGRREIPKYLTEKEFADVSRAGLRVFPIYQDGGYNISYFNYNPYKQGISDAKKANDAAQKIGIPKNTYIYFAIDLDVKEDKIYELIIPYFKGIVKELKNYQIGVYGTRNVCRIVQENFALQRKILPFVSNISHNYCGNKGFPMPNKWAFDQFDDMNSKRRFDPKQYLPKEMQKVPGLIVKFDLDKVATSEIDKGCRKSTRGII